MFDAVNENDIAKLTKLLSIKSNEHAINETDMGQSLLMMSCDFGHAQITKLLLQRGGDSEIRDRKGMTAIVYAIRNNHYDCVENLCKYSRNKVNVEIADNKGMTPLLMCAERGDYNYVKFLLEYGANVNIQNHKKHSALMLAVLNNHTSTVQILIEYKADTHLIDSNGRTTYEYAANKNIEIQNMILLNLSSSSSSKNIPSSTSSTNKNTLGTTASTSSQCSSGISLANMTMNDMLEIDEENQDPFRSASSRGRAVTTAVIPSSASSKKESKSAGSDKSKIYKYVY